MGDDFDDASDEELFNDDFDDTDTVLRGVKKRVCPEHQRSLEYRVEGRFVVRYCPEKGCKYEAED